MVPLTPYLQFKETTTAPAVDLKVEAQLKVMMLTEARFPPASL